MKVYMNLEPKVVSTPSKISLIQAFRYCGMDLSTAKRCAEEYGLYPFEYGDAQELILCLSPEQVVAMTFKNKTDIHGTKKLRFEEYFRVTRGPYFNERAFIDASEGSWT